MYFYTYAHVRPDTGAIFYVGKGSNKRAYDTKDRNSHWHNVVTKNNDTFKVVILNWFNNEKDAFDAEVWQIAKLQPLDCLVNITNGGDQPPINRMFGLQNPMSRAEVAAKAKESAKALREDPKYRQYISAARKGKGTGDNNAMRKPAQEGIFSGLNNSMAKYEHREKHYSNNKTRGVRNGMYGKTGDLNPAFGKPSAMRGKKNLGIAWAAANKTWQFSWGA
jgi:stalled ribosome alternative rescue factor ArfA